jgi:16S rRNA (guanine527-N7)-methyltransferase
VRAAIARSWSFRRAPPSTSRRGAKRPRRRSATTAERRSTWNGIAPERLAAAEARLRAGLSELALDPSADQIDSLLRLAALLERWATRINLSAHRDVDSIVARLILDAAALLLQMPATDGLVDLGAGAGFPGLPIAVLRPGCEVLLVEAREKRHHFQRAALRELALRNCEPLRGRAEALAPRPRGVVVAQAISEPAQALRWMLPWAAPDGWLLLPGGEQPPDIVAPSGVHRVEVRRYQVPGGGPRRTLWLGRRTA